jgi:UDP-glucose 4-epimerase
VESKTEKSKKVLIVGKGYLGHSVERALKESKYTPVTLNRSARSEAADSIQYTGSMHERGLLEKIYKENPCDTLIILAADKDPAKAAADPVACMKNNVGHTTELVTNAIELGIKNIIFTSTSMVLAAQDGVALKEDAPFTTSGVYAKSKICEEEVLKTLTTEKNGVRIRVVRVSNIGGAEEDSPEHAGVLAAFVEAARKGEEKTIVGKTNEQGIFQSVIRDFISVIDAGNIFPKIVDELCSKEKVDAFDVINLGSGRGTSLQELANAAQEVTEKTFQPKKTEMPKGTILSTVLDNSKARAKYKWEPIHSYPKMMARSEFKNQKQREQQKFQKEKLTQQRKMLITGMGAFGFFLTAAAVISGICNQNAPSNPTPLQPTKY